MVKKLLILIILAVLAYATYRVVIYFSDPITNIKKQGSEKSMPDDDSSRLEDGFPLRDKGSAVIYSV